MLLFQTKGLYSDPHTLARVRPVGTEGIGSIALPFSTTPLRSRASQSTPLLRLPGFAPSRSNSEGVRNRTSVVGVSNDLSADALSRIRNAYFRSFQDVVIVDSKEIRELLNALVHAGYIHN